MDSCSGERRLTPVRADTAETLPYTLVQRVPHSMASGPGGTQGGLVTSLVVTSPGTEAGWHTMRRQAGCQNGWAEAKIGKYRPTYILARTFKKEERTAPT